MLEYFRAKSYRRSDLTWVWAIVGLCVANRSSLELGLCTSLVVKSTTADVVLKAILQGGFNYGCSRTA